MRSPSIHRSCRRARRLGFGLLLLVLPACGLSDYEAKTLETQQRAERFDKEQKYLDEPVQMPTTTDKDGNKVPEADVFFRPPKGIDAKPEPSPLGNGLLRYAGHAGKSDFVFVELAFDAGNKDFTDEAQRNYGAQYDYSVNVLKGGKTQVVIYVFAKGQRDKLRTAMDLSLHSLAVDQKVAAARQKYRDKSPWRLKPTPTP